MIENEYILLQQASKIIFMKSIGVIANDIFIPLFQKHRQLQLMMDWPLIVGKDIASFTWPTKIIPCQFRENILYIDVVASKKLEAWGASTLIMERINQYFGWKMIGQVKLVSHHKSIAKNKSNQSYTGF